MKGLLFTALALTLAASTLKAQPTERPATYKTPYECVVANQFCFVVRAGVADLTPTQRVDRLNDRLAYVLGYENLRPENIYIVQVKGDPEIWVGHSLLFDVTEADARADGSTPTDLAKKWTANLRQALPQARPIE